MSGGRRQDELNACRMDASTALWKMNFVKKYEKVPMYGDQFSRTLRTLVKSLRRKGLWPGHGFDRLYYRELRLRGATNLNKVGKTQGWREVNLSIS